MTVSRLGLVALVAALYGCSGGPQTPPPSGVQRLNAEGLRRLERGDVEGADDMLHAALREAELVDDLLGQAEAWNNLGALALSKGDATGAWACHAAALRLYAARGQRDEGEVRTRTNLGSAQLLAGRPAEAKQQFEAAIALAASLGKPGSAVLARVGLASAALHQGDVQLASKVAGEIEDEARKANDDSSLGAALALSATAREAAGDLAGAQQRYEEALTIDRKREQPHAVAGDLRALSRVAERKGDGPAAAAYLARAARIARRLGQLDRAEAELARAVELAQTRAPDDAAAYRGELDALKAAIAKQPKKTPSN